MLMAIMVMLMMLFLDVIAVNNDCDGDDSVVVVDMIVCVNVVVVC